jgi:hypothetical protein
MAEFEIAKYYGNKTKEATKKKVASPKEKTQNICKQFNAICRRRFIKRFFFNSFDMDLHDEMCIENNFFFLRFG